MAGKIGFFDEVTEMIQEEAGQATKAVKQQVTGNTSQQGATQNLPQQQGTPQDQVGKVSEQGGSAQTQGQTDDIVKQLYGSGQLPIDQGEVAAKELEDKQKEEALRQRLHSEYYQNLTNPPKQQEERPAEKIGREEEEKKEMVLQEEEKKKKEELPVVATKNMGTSEKLRGVSG